MLSASNAQCAMNKRLLKDVYVVLWMKTEAQLSQRNRATLRVTEYFANNPSSLKIIRNNTLEYGVCKSLVFHWNDVCISYHFWDIQHQTMAWPWNRAPLWSFKVVENGWRCSIDHYDLLLVGHCMIVNCIALILHHFRARPIWRWIISWPWNLG